MIPTPTILNLTVTNGWSARSVASPVSSWDVQDMLALFDGHTVEAKVYSGTNKCFDVTEAMILDAWDKMDKDKFFWMTEDKLPHLIEKFTVKGDNGHTLAMSLPNLFCEETPAEIEEMLKVVS